MKRREKTMKKNLVVMATSVALSASMAFATPAYAGVVKRNATGAFPE